MKKKAVILTNSNLFTIISQAALTPYYECKVLNLRYSNETMTRDEHFIQQIKELFNDNFVKRGFLSTKYDFMFTEALERRIDTLFSEGLPHLLFFEMKTGKASEWSVLEYINEHFDVPIVAFLPPHKDKEEVIFRLLSNGVKEVITRFDVSVFEKIAKRNNGTR